VIGSIVAPEKRWPAEAPASSRKAGEVERYGGLVASNERALAVADRVAGFTEDDLPLRVVVSVASGTEPPQGLAVAPPLPSQKAAQAAREAGCKRQEGH